MTDAWLIIGAEENWRRALDQPVPLWGLKPSYAAEFSNLSEGSRAWLYVNRPVGGVVGLAAIREKYRDDSTPLWPDEVRQGRVIWPLRFRLEVKKVLPRERWERDRIDIRDFNLFWQKGFQLLTADRDAELLDRFRRRFGWEREEAIDQGASLVEPGHVAETLVRPEPAPPMPLVSEHRRLQEVLAEIGRLQHFHSQIEFPIALEGGGRSLDVVWKREISGVPTFAFEIELSGAIEKAVLRLKFAHDRWNSRPRMVVPPDRHAQLRDVLSVQGSAFAQQVRICTGEQIYDLRRRKGELRALEQQLGLY